MNHPLPTLVLDTNVVLDWLVFRNPVCTPLAQALASGQVRWIATAAMRNELAHVLGRGVLSAWSPDETQLWDAWDRFALIVDDPSPSGDALRLKCTDTDDQKFVDLALAQANGLLSHDRAVLKLARRAFALGVRVQTPDRWASEFALAATA